MLWTALKVLRSVQHQAGHLKGETRHCCVCSVEVYNKPIGADLVMIGLRNRSVTNQSLINPADWETDLIRMND